jgi:DNA recombination protein RmuC
MELLLAGLAGIAIGLIIYRFLGSTDRSRYDERIRTLETTVTERNTALDAMQRNLSSEQQLRARAQTEAERIPTLEREKVAERQRVDQLAETNASLQARIAELETALEKQLQFHDQQIATYRDAEENLKNIFGDLSRKALSSNASDFLNLARTEFSKLQEHAKTELDKKEKAIENLVDPVKESLKEVDKYIHDVERQRVGAYSKLEEQLQSLLGETTKLSKALSAPMTRGRWGEFQLRRVVELAGMLEYCDFDEQQTVTTEDGRMRPDMVVRLPGGKSIVVDSKVPLAAFLSAAETDNDLAREKYFADHAKQLRNHIKDLSRKSYWEQFRPTPEFVVMFIPSEVALTSALKYDPELIEYGVAEKVLTASPITLIALLRSAAYGWRQEKLAENAEKISKLGRELYDSLSVFSGHFSSVGKNLRQTVDTYNKAVSSIEGRVLVRARRFNDLESGSATKEIEEQLSVDVLPKLIESSELLPFPIENEVGRKSGTNGQA